MKETFGVLPSGKKASLYTISCGGITACVTDYGASLVRLLVPGKGGAADVVLGFDDCNGYRTGNGGCLGGTVGRNSNRVKGASFLLNGAEHKMKANEGANNLHSGPDFYFQRLWKLVKHTRQSVTLSLHSPHGDQGFPGNADIQVTYALDGMGGLHIPYDATCDQDTVFNMTTTAILTWRATRTLARLWTRSSPSPASFSTPTMRRISPRASSRRWQAPPWISAPPRPLAGILTWISRP